MTMKTERWMNDESFVNSEHERTVNAERKTVNDKRTISAPWTHGEGTVSERKNGRVECFRDCIYGNKISISNKFCCFH